MGGIAPPSSYAAFGSKGRLFEEAVELYRATVGGDPARALAGASTARDAIEAMLSAAASSFCMPGKPRGCLLVVGAMAAWGAMTTPNVSAILTALAEAAMMRREGTAMTVVCTATSIGTCPAALH